MSSELIERLPAGGMSIDIMDRLETATFDELASTVIGAMDKAGMLAEAVIEQFIRAGGALCEMRDRMPGQYSVWLKENGIDVANAARLQRLYTYRDQLPAHVFQPAVTHGRVRDVTRPPTLHRALQSISELPALTFRGSKGRPPKVPRSEIASLLAKGLTAREVANRTGVSMRRVIEVKDPDAYKRSRERAQQREKDKRAAAAALAAQQRRSERDALAKANGKELSVAYGEIRKALAALDRAATMDNAPLRHIRRANEYLSAAESAVVSALREDRHE